MLLRVLDDIEYSSDNEKIAMHNLVSNWTSINRNNSVKVYGKPTMNSINNFEEDVTVVSIRFVRIINLSIQCGVGCLMSSYPFGYILIFRVPVWYRYTMAHVNVKVLHGHYIIVYRCNKNTQLQEVCLYSTATSYCNDY